MQVVDAFGNLAHPQALKVNAIAATDGKGHQKTPTITEMHDGRLAVTWYDGSSNTIGTYIGTTIVDARVKAVNVSGTEGADIYHGTEYAEDRLYGNGGNDALYGGDLRDFLYGGIGNDTLYGGNRR